MYQSHPLAALEQLRASGTTTLRGLKIIVALVSLSATPSCSESPVGPARFSTQTVACVARNVRPRDAKTRYCDEDLDDEPDRKREKKVPAQQLPN